MSKNVDFRKLAEDRFEITLPAGIRPSVAAAAIFKVRGMALDAAPDGERRRETSFQKLLRIISNAGLPPETVAACERALTDLAGERDGERDDDESEALDEEEEGAGEEWWNDPEQRSRHWRATDRFLRSKNVPAADLEELRPMWEKHWGKLPLRNATEGGLGGATARDRKRRQAFDRRYPGSKRLDPQSALETSYGIRAAVRREPLSEGTVSRWGDVLERIGHV